MELPVHSQLPGVMIQDGVQVELLETERRILRIVSGEPLKTTEIAIELGYSTRTRNVRTALKSLLEANLLELTIPQKPNSRNQKMRITEAGRAWLAAHPQ